MVELCDLDNAELIRLIGDRKVEIVVAHDILGRLMIHCARQVRFVKLWLCLHKYFIG